MGSRQLVWSPTSGTRQLRAGETYHDQSSAAHLSNPMMPGHEMYHNQSPPAAGPVNPLTSSQDISPYVSLSQKAQTSERFPESASTTPQKSHTRKSATNTPASMTPLPIEQPHSPRNPASSGSQLDSYQYPFVPAESAPGRFQENGRLRRKYRKYTEAAPGHDRIEQMMGQTRLTDDPSRMSSSPQFSGPRYPVEYIRGHPGGEPFSAPPTVSSYGELDNTSQDTYGGLASPLHSQNFVPNVDIWGPQSAVSGAQMQAGMAPVPSNFMGPDGPMVPNPIAPSERMQSASLHAQEAILRAQDNTMPPIPPPGSMPPLEHWNMLYQREMEIVSRLQNANVPITDLQRRYIAMLGEARMNAVATRIPPRGSKSTRRWLKLLREMLEDIWKNQPGQMPLTPMIVARKQDYERAVNREIAMVMTETRPGGYPTGVNRGYNG